MKQYAFAIGIGVGTRNSRGEWLEMRFPRPLLPSPVKQLNEAFARAQQLLEPLLDASESEAVIALPSAEHQETVRELSALSNLGARHQSGLCAVVLYRDSPPRSVPSAYLKLHLLSHRLFKPNQLNLDGIFALLPNLIWTNFGPLDEEAYEQYQRQTRKAGTFLQTLSVDKFPRMTDYVIPSKVRIADCSRVRLGAYLGEQTTVMHEGFVNFNAGCAGPNMIEGRISQGVFVGEHTDLGGGSSTMGTLSGGNETVISIGARCLIGANAGVGIPLGDNCIVEAGLYVTAGSVISVIDQSTMREIKRLKARELSGKSNLLFRRNSQSGTMECLTNHAAVELNETLHAHN